MYANTSVRSQNGTMQEYKHATIMKHATQTSAMA